MAGEAVREPARGLRALRYAPRLLWLHARMDLLWLARDWRSAVAWIVADIVMSLGVVATTFLLAARFDGIGSWSYGEVVFLLGYALLVRGLLDAVFGYNLSFISRRIGRGQLDHMLVQPQPLWLCIGTEGCSPFSGSGIALCGAALVGWSVVSESLVVAWGWLLPELVASMAVVLAFSYAWACAAFWAPRAAEEINSGSMRLLDELRGFPLDGMPPLLVGGLLTVVPVGFVAWWPSRALLDPTAGLAERLATPAFALGFGALTILLFLRGLRQYGRTGSHRYLDHGHRR